MSTPRESDAPVLNFAPESERCQRDYIGAGHARNENGIAYSPIGVDAF